MKYLQFENGDKMPAIGLGTWKSAKGEVYKVVREAINVGYRHFDCALIYGNEAEIGEAFNDAFLNADVKREELWITSKLWNNAHKKEAVLPNIQKTIADLKIVYLDLYLIHWPVALKPEIMFPQKGDELVSLAEIPLSETWNAMNKLKEDGLIKHIGVSNFGPKKLQRLIDETGIKPEMNQVEMHPFLQQQNLKAFCDTNKILLTAYSPLGSLDRPENRKTTGEPLLFDNQVIKQLAENKGVSIGQLLLAWAVNYGIAVIPKTVRKERLIENLASADIDLTEPEMNKIAEVNKNYRYIKGDFWCLPGSDYDFNTFWD